MTDQTRANFEAHFQLTTRQAWQHPDGSYKFPEIQAKWEGYQAGVAKAAPVAEQEPIGKVCVFRDTADGDVFDIATTGEQRERIMQMDGMPIYAAPVAAAAPGAVQEPVEYQVRTRPMWRDEAEGWTEWRKCSPESYADYVRVPVLHDWQHETRALYAAPVAAAAPGAVPQTDLQREIARDAEAFEATLTERPARESSLAYPWGWRYVSNEVQGQFRDWCCRHPK